MKTFPWRVLVKHFVLTLKLNFRSPQPLIYGYFVPVLFLLAFGAVFRGETPVLRNQMGQLLTICILGGACFGLPTALVSERERGLWKNYHILPLHHGWLLLSTLLVRVVLLASAAGLQILLAHSLYGTPWPVNLPLFLGGFLLTCLCFMGLGLLVAALADTVPAVQAIGQCLFLPMLMIGGVGVPLAVLPDWAAIAAGFMPGRYAVALLHAGYTDSLGLYPIGFPLFALGCIGLCSGIVGLSLFRWDNAEAPSRRQSLKATLALGAWLLVGAAAAFSGRLGSQALLEEGLEELTPALLAQISYDEIPDDTGFVSRLAPPFAPGALPAEVKDLAEKLENWQAAKAGSPLQVIRLQLCAAAIADLSRDPREAVLARLVFDKLIREKQPEELRKALGWIILRPEDGQVLLSVPELGLRRRVDENLVRERTTFYAKKLLGRLLGQIRDEPRAR